MAAVSNYSESSTRSFEVTGITSEEMTTILLEGVKVVMGVDFPADVTLDADDFLRLTEGVNTLFTKGDGGLWKIAITETD